MIDHHGRSWTVILNTEKQKVGAAPQGAVGPASAAGLTLAARPPHTGPPGRGMSDRLQATPILLTQLLTTNLDERGRGWNRNVTMGRASGPYGRRRRIWTNLILLRIRRLGVRVPPSAPMFSQAGALVMRRPVRPRHHLAAFRWHRRRRRTSRPLRFGVLTEGDAPVCRVKSGSVGTVQNAAATPGRKAPSSSCRLRARADRWVVMDAWPGGRPTGRGSMPRG